MPLINLISNLSKIKQIVVILVLLLQTFRPQTSSKWQALSTRSNVKHYQVKRCTYSLNFVFTLTKQQIRQSDCMCRRVQAMFVHTVMNNRLNHLTMSHHRCVEFLKRFPQLSNLQPAQHAVRNVITQKLAHSSFSISTCTVASSMQYAELNTGNTTPHTTVNHIMQFFNIVFLNYQVLYIPCVFRKVH